MSFKMVELISTVHHCKVWGEHRTDWKRSIVLYDYLIETSQVPSLEETMIGFYTSSIKNRKKLRAAKIKQIKQGLEAASLLIAGALGMGIISKLISEWSYGGTDFIKDALNAIHGVKGGERDA